MERGKGRKKEVGRRHVSKKKLTYGLIVVAFIVTCFLTYSSLRLSNQASDEESSPKAALIDHLSTSAPNETFKQTATSILRAANISVRYYPGENVTVNFYRDLPKHGYSLIILRVHSAIIEGTESIGLFTSEEYRRYKYTNEQDDGRLVKALFTKGGTEYFGISPKFVERSMRGNFLDTLIIMMGCDGLTYNTMADAFVDEKGAKVYIGWNGLVGVAHTDQTTICLLRHLIAYRKTIKVAVEKTREAIGQDPEYGSAIDYHPKNVGNYVIPNIVSILKMNIAEINTIYVKFLYSRIKPFHRSPGS